MGKIIISCTNLHNSLIRHKKSIILKTLTIYSCRVHSALSSGKILRRSRDQWPRSEGGSNSPVGFGLRPKTQAVCLKKSTLRKTNASTFSFIISSSKAAIYYSVGRSVYLTPDDKGYWSENKSSFTVMLPLHCT